MNISFDRHTALNLLRHVGRKPNSRLRADRDVRVIAANGKLYFVDTHTTAACDALVLEGGAFWIGRAFLEKILRSYVDREVILLEAGVGRLKIGRFSCGLSNYEPAPEPPPRAASFPTTETAARAGKAGSM